METKNNFNVKILRTEHGTFPMVLVDYLDRYAQEHTGLLLLDSCSMDNILFCQYVEELWEQCILKNETKDIYSLGGNVFTAKKAKFSFALGCQQFTEKFCLCEEFSRIVFGDMPLIGIIGNQFMEKHQLVIDYSTYRFYKSCATPDNLLLAECDFFCPMDLGMKYYGLPVLFIKQNEKEIIAIADTGATNNLIALPTINDNAFTHQYLQKTEMVSGLVECVETKIATVDFHLLSLTEGDVKKAIPFRDDFRITQEYILPNTNMPCDEDGDQLPSVEALIGSPFMAQKGWVLDFGAKIIYKRKSA